MFKSQSLDKNRDSFLITQKQVESHLKVSLLDSLTGHIPHLDD